MNFAEMQSELGSSANLIIILIGVLIYGFGVAFLIVNRRMIKLLYFISGLQLFATVAFVIGATILFNTNALDDKNFTPVYILLSLSAGIGLIGGILTSCFGRFGVVVLGMTAGVNIWQLAAGFVDSHITNVICSFVLALIGAIVCYNYKRPIEIIIVAFTGAHLATKGPYLVAEGAMHLNNIALEKVVKFMFYPLISEVVLKSVIFVVNAVYHLNNYATYCKEEHILEESQDMQEEQPMLERHYSENHSAPRNRLGGFVV